MEHTHTHTHTIGVGKGANFKVWSNKFIALARSGKSSPERARENGVLVKESCQKTVCLTQSKL